MRIWHLEKRSLQKHTPTHEPVQSEKKGHLNWSFVSHNLFPTIECSCTKASCSACYDGRGADQRRGQEKYLPFSVSLPATNGVSSDLLKFFGWWKLVEKKGVCWAVKNRIAYGHRTHPSYPHMAPPLPNLHPITPTLPAYLWSQVLEWAIMAALILDARSEIAVDSPFCTIP